MQGCASHNFYEWVNDVNFLNRNEKWWLRILSSGINKDIPILLDIFYVYRCEGLCSFFYPQ